MGDLSSVSPSRTETIAAPNRGPKTYCSRQNTQRLYEEICSARTKAAFLGDSRRMVERAMTIVLKSEHVDGLRRPMASKEGMRMSRDIVSVDKR